MAEKIKLVEPNVCPSKSELVNTKWKNERPVGDSKSLKKSQVNANDKNMDVEERHALTI